MKRHPLAALRYAAALVVVLILGSAVATDGAQQPPAPAQSPGTSSVPVSELETAVEKNPGDPKPLVLLGLAYWDQNDYSRALAIFERAVKVGPRSAEAHNWLGVALSGKADLPGAIAAFRKAV